MAKSKSKTRSYSDKTLKILYGNAAGRCSKCKRSVILEASDGKEEQLGEIAHIYPFGKIKAPRYDEIEKDGFDINFRDDTKNLILLCQNCHAEVDKIPQDFQAEKLLKMKQEHEDWVEQRLQQGFSNISYKELDIICKAIANCSQQYTNQMDYSPIQIEEKITKNGLSNRIYHLIQQGMLRTKFVHEYLNAQINVTFADDLLKCIKSIYREESKNYQGDELFLSMLNRMNAGIEEDITKQAAGISVLTYFFHICEVFEK